MSQRDITPLPAADFDDLVETLDEPDPAPELARRARERRDRR